MRFVPQRKNYPIVKVGETYYIDEVKVLEEENEKLRQENERLIRIEKEYNAHCEYLDSIEGIDIIRENKKLKDRVKELENACCEEAVKKNIALNAYEMTIVKLGEMFIKPELINDISFRVNRKEGKNFFFTFAVPWEKVKKELPEKSIEIYEKAEEVKQNEQKRFF